MSMAIVGGITAGAVLIGGYMQSQAIGDAADAQSQSSREAMQMQQQMYNQTREDNRVARETGDYALGELKSNQFMNNWQTDPGYQFRMQEGQKAINQSAAARGLNNSGATLKALTRYGQDYSSGEYGKVYDRNVGRLNSMLGIGTNATNQTNAAGANYANNGSNIITNQGNSQAAGAIAQGNNINNSLNQGANSWMNYNMMNSLFKQAPASNAQAYSGTGYLGGSYNF